MGSIEESRLNELKAQCVEDESEEAHAAHAEALEKAYREFAGRSVSNPAKPGVVTSLEADIAVAGDMPTG